METTAQAGSKPGYTLWQLVLYILKLGTWGFGGPVALVGYMRRDLVDARRWISEEDSPTRTRQTGLGGRDRRWYN